MDDDDDNGLGSPDEVIADIISRLIAGDMGSGEEWRPAAALESLAQGLVAICEGEEDPGRKALAKEILGDIMLAMTYLELREPDEADEEQDAYDRQWDKIVARIMRQDQDQDQEKDE